MPNESYIQEMQDLYERTLKQNHGRSAAGIICPRTYDNQETKNECKLCELCKTVLTNWETPQDDPLKIKARRVNSKTKYYSNVIFMTNPAEVIVLEYGDKIMNQLIAGQMDDLSEWKNFMHPSRGRNLYITKVKLGPAKKDVDYKVEPRMSVSPLPDPTVLTRLYDIFNITALITSGKVKPVFQSKFDFAKTEVRFLPSGDKTKPLMFYTPAAWHYNVTPEEFAAIQRGDYNPITGVYVQIKKPVETEFQTKSSTIAPIGYSKTISNEDLLAEWGGGLSDLEPDSLSEELPQSEDNFETETGIEPICFGQYDKLNATCIGRCTNDGWGEGCHKVTEEKTALRVKAKRLSK